MSTRDRPADLQGAKSAHAGPGGMRDALSEPEPTGFACAACGRFVITAVEGLFRSVRAGSPRRFCDHACRQAAYRRRRAEVAEDTPLQHQGGRNRRLVPVQRPPQPQPAMPKPDAPREETV
jgi:hypothetical protein